MEVSVEVRGSESCVGVDGWEAFCCSIFGRRRVVDGCRPRDLGKEGMHVCGRKAAFISQSMNGRDDVVGDEITLHAIYVQRELRR